MGRQAKGLAAVVGFFLLTAGPARAGVAPPHSTLFGRTIGDYTADWWQYALSVPAADNPLFDKTGAKASIGQHGPVYFLTGIITFNQVGITAKANRSITITDKTYLLFPLINGELDNLGVDPPLSVATLRKNLKDNINLTTALHASIDGKAVPHLFSHRETSPVFSYSLPPHNLLEKFGYDFPAQTVYPGVSDGYWLLVNPLSAGSHKINFGGTQALDPVFNIDITYKIKVLSTGGSVSHAQAPQAVPVPAAASMGLVSLPLMAWSCLRLRRSCAARVE